MKKIVLSFCALLCAIFCYAQNCTINGRINVQDFQNKEVSILNTVTGKVLATTTIKDSAFTFNVPVTEPFWGLIKTASVGGKNYYFLKVVIESGAVNCDLVTDDLSGTPTNEKYCKYNQKMHQEKEIWYAIAEKYEHFDQMSQEQMKSLAGEMQAQVSKMKEVTENAFQDNKDNLAGAMIFCDLIEMVEYKAVNYNELTTLLAGAAPVVRNYPPLVEKMNLLDKLNQTAVGKPYVDLDLKDFKSGKSVKLSKYIKGKIALVDFWASWCRPCRAEIPNIAKIYEKYGKDIVVISLNVWDKPDAQAKAIKDLKMNWVQLTDNSKKSTEVYGIEGIPHIMLIGKDGKILARDLRGEEIEEAVKEALK